MKLKQSHPVLLHNEWACYIWDRLVSGPCRVIDLADKKSAIAQRDVLALLEILQQEGKVVVSNHGRQSDRTAQITVPLNTVCEVCNRPIHTSQIIASCIRCDRAMCEICGHAITVVGIDAVQCRDCDTKPQKNSPGVHCCLYCGRDTQSRCQICQRCMAAPEHRPYTRKDELEQLNRQHEGRWETDELDPQVMFEDEEFSQQ